ncbi:MAG: arginyltransferase [Planctomycetota bacterium]|nr:arginyltransferase [Planctomycetota bacterium]
MTYHSPFAMSPSSAYPSLPPPINIPLSTEPEQPCPYLPNRCIRTRYFAATAFPPDLYHHFMDSNFRRSGLIFYQPVCRNCRACMQIRVAVDQFKPTKSQRRCHRRNQNLNITVVDDPTPTDEKFALYQRYLTQRHAGHAHDDRDRFESFLYTSPVKTIEICYRTPGGDLIAVGLCDLSSRALSSVYFYFAPNELRRSLGTFSILHEIALTRKLNRPHYYLGYWIKDCPSMEYKSNFHPAEVLHPDGRWQPA